MKRVTPALVTMLMLGVVGFLVVAYVAKKYLFAAPVQAQAAPRRNIPTAIVKITPGTMITERHLGVAPISVDRIDADTLVSSRVILGRIAKREILPLQEIKTDDLYAPGDGPEISVAPGMRAITLQLGDQSDIVDNLIRPGQYADVHFHPQAQSQDARLRKGLVMTLFKGVKILAVNRSFQPTDSNRSGTTVTFELSEEQANIMLVARDHGEITLAYTPEGKGTEGATVDDASRAYLEEVLGLAPLPEPEKPLRIDQYRGAAHTTLQFQDGRPARGGQSNDQRGYDWDPDQGGFYRRSGQRQDDTDKRSTTIGQREPRQPTNPRGT